MKPAPFDYCCPDSVAEAVEVLAANKGEAKVMAGGQSLGPMLNFRVVRPALIVDVSRLLELDYVRQRKDGGLSIGALTRHRELETSALVAARFPVIPETMRHVAHLAIRNRGTIGGSLSHADPAAELPMLVRLLDAQIAISSARGERTVSAHDFFIGPLSTVLDEDELVVRIELPGMRHNGRGRRAARRVRGQGARRARGDDGRGGHAAALSRGRRRAQGKRPGRRRGGACRASRLQRPGAERGPACVAGIPPPLGVGAGQALYPEGPEPHRGKVGMNERGVKLHPVWMLVNGKVEEHEVEPRMLLSDFLRQRLGLTGTHVGCEHGVCGACTVMVDGDSVRSCLMLAVRANGTEIRTVESMGCIDALSPLQEAFREHHGLQCGFCTPGMLATCADALQKCALDTEQEIRDALSGNLCRCTGYQGIVEAVKVCVTARNALRTAAADGAPGTEETTP
jgi:xanthine dehydrogenase iron-sulfur cluster and FAD-binding subunit A